ncbi:hypothetical protein BD560DRAFT_373281 [Blakeslea trispora]|nr:hypothetical protein BD560DRAFT_373281 [Blakeslea trispora]
MSACAAANRLSINVWTAQNWIKKDSVTPQGFIERASGSGRQVGRPPTLTEEHRKYTVEWADSNTDSVTLDGMLNMLTEKFGKVEITKSGFNKFVKDRCNITFKQAHPGSVERSSSE